MVDDECAEFLWLHPILKIGEKCNICLGLLEQLKVRFKLEIKLLHLKDSPQVLLRVPIFLDSLVSKTMHEKDLTCSVLCVHELVYRTLWEVFHRVIRRLCRFNVTTIAILKHTKKNICWNNDLLDDLMSNLFTQCSQQNKNIRGM